MKTIFWYSVLSSFIHNSVVSATQGILHCPEQLGGDIQACVAKLCGGQDSKNGGHCINKVANQPACSCSLSRNQTAIAGPALTTVVATHSGKAVTATYALATLTSYSNLRQSITTTVTLAPTASDAPAATAAVAVFAGGVAWYLAALVGEEAAATIIKPPSDAGDHPDDKTCPSNKHSCSDCAGTLGICVTPDGGCACENKKCPDKKPSCSAKGCAGVNKKCTLGDVKDCAYAFLCQLWRGRQEQQG
ncbi:hypothetical protein GQ43DRAFT_269030 [Delitschia confertaspora ATCC 74209]|uniref:Uncharacterized protein n=1 Tax=Delitschia confertaspora ATCC 74209 TaxID=1513339 RepID=A0A9P4MMK9_9PLEO|nr:hypothetical protein GQ43DRAFT_269030 [Delitschia confertaspora ATCC 74209]